jgi:hypothetical protein
VCIAWLSISRIDILAQEWAVHGVLVWRLSEADLEAQRGRPCANLQGEVGRYGGPSVESICGDKCPTSVPHGWGRGREGGISVIQAYKSTGVGGRE